MIALLAQTTEPAPQGWTATGEALLRHAETRPDAFWPVVAVALPLLLVAGIGIIVIRFMLPAWREEKKADRDALVTALKQRGEEAERDAAKDRELAKTQSEALVGRIENKVDRITSEIAKIDGRVERHSEVLARIVVKVGASSAILAAFLGGAAAGAGWLALVDRPVATVLAAAALAPAATPTSCSTAQTNETATGECPKGCPTDSKCCGPSKCCPKSKATAKSPGSPVSSLHVASLDRYAAAICDPEFDDCSFD